MPAQSSDGFSPPSPSLKQKTFWRSILSLADPKLELRAARPEVLPPIPLAFNKTRHGKGDIYISVLFPNVSNNSETISFTACRTSMLMREPSSREDGSMPRTRTFEPMLSSRYRTR